MDLRCSRWLRISFHKPNADNKPACKFHPPSHAFPTPHSSHLEAGKPPAATIPWLFCRETIFPTYTHNLMSPACCQRGSLPCREPAAERNCISSIVKQPTIDAVQLFQSLLIQNPTGEGPSGGLCKLQHVFSSFKGSATLAAQCRLRRLCFFLLQYQALVQHYSPGTSSYLPDLSELSIAIKCAMN